MKHITDPSQVKAGFYIRAYVNHLGDCAVEIVEVIGKSFMADWCMNQKLLAFNTRTKYGVRQSYASDLGATGQRETRLYPFSNKLYNQLMQLQGGWNYNKPNRAFTEFIKGKKFSDQSWEDQKSTWEYEIEMDKAMMRDLLREVN